MPTLTHNLFWGQGEREHRLEVIDGRWPDDLFGAVFVVGPDKRAPGGHWFAEQGLLCRIDLAPDPEGRIRVRHRRVETPVSRLRARLPFLFRQVSILQLSPFGVSNLANTNVQAFDGRLFVGYDAGRPVEVDPETLETLGFVGHNGEWAQSLPGLLEPLVSVAAHPAPAWDEGALYFANYSAGPAPAGETRTHLVRWPLAGPLARWSLPDVRDFDSIHDLKATRDHVVICDLPFVVEPGSFRGAPRTRANQEHTRLWIVRKEDLRRTPPGGDVPAREVRLPLPTGHITLDVDDSDGRLRVYLQHIPVTDLMIALHRDELDHRGLRAFDPEYEGLVPLGVQPGAVGRAVIDAATGELLEHRVAHDPRRFWGGVLWTQDLAHAEARRRPRSLYFGGIGFDPELLPATWWRLYADVKEGALVPPRELPNQPVPGALARFDLERMEVAEVFPYEAGAFPHPPTFAPRRDARGPEDGYVVVIRHGDGPKEVQVFDARDLARGPVARASAPDFRPPLLLHSCWMAPREGPRRGEPAPPLWRDVAGALAAWPGHARALFRLGRSLSGQSR